MGGFKLPKITRSKQKESEPWHIATNFLTGGANLPAAAAILSRKTGGDDEEAAKKEIGGEHGGGGGGMSAEQAWQAQMDAWFKNNPKFAEQYWQLAKKYEPQYADLMQGIAGKERTADIGDVARLAPGLRSISEATERPEALAIRQNLLDQIGQEVSLGGQLSPSESLQANESIRSGLMARGISGGQPGSNREAVQRALESMGLQERRQNKGMAMLAQERADKVDPFATVLGRPSALTAGAVGQTQANIKDPSLDFFSSNYWNAQQSGDAANKYNLMLDIAKMNPWLQTGN